MVIFAKQNIFLKKTMKKNKKLTFMVGIPTCYGGESLINTVKTLRASKGVSNFRIIIIADRTPIKKSIKDKLAKMGVEIFWNKKEGSQFKKLKQLIQKCKEDIFVFTQDDITFDKYTLKNILRTFKENPQATMASATILPLPPLTFFESIKTSETRIHNNITKKWNNADNYFASSGRCISFKTKHIKKFRVPENVVNGDTYLYFENKRLNGIHIHQPSSRVFIRCPQRLKDEIGPSSRFQYSQIEMAKYFDYDLKKEYKIPRRVFMQSFLEELISHPFKTALLVGVILLLRIKRQKVSVVSDPVWKVDISTKRIG